MKTFIFALSALLFTYNIFSQVYEEEDIVMSPSTDFYSNNYLYGSNTGKGNTGIAGENDISAFLLNPAAIKFNKKYIVNLQYVFKTDRRVTYTSGIYTNSYDLTHIPLSLSGGFGIKLNEQLTAAFLYSNTNNEKIDFSDEPVTSTDLTFSYNVHSLNLPVTYTYKNFSIGINPSYSFYNNHITGATTIIDPINPHDITNSFERFNVQVGLKVTPAKNISAGLTFTPGFKADVISSEDYSVSPNIKLVAVYPFKVTAGMEFLVLKEKLRLSFDYNFQRTSEIKGYLDKNDFNFGGEYTANKNLILRAGFFTLFDIRDFHSTGVGFPGKEGDFTQLFITAGITYKVKDLNISVGVTDSHISSGLIKVLKVNSSISYNF